MREKCVEKWMVYAKKADFNALGKQFSISPITARILRNRDIITEEEMEYFLYGTLEDLHDPRQMKDVELAASILKKKIEEKKKIRVIGDYDIDGVCASYILITALQGLGGIVDHRLPERQKDGYGMQISMIEEAREAGIDTIITCDNGIAASEAVKLAKVYHMTVIVTDHHEVPLENDEEKIPDADAVVDPKQRACKYPFPEICGAVVAWKLMQILYESMGHSAHEIRDGFLEFAAIATVGDVMRLQNENRILVKYGLKKLKETRSAGLRALIQVNELADKKINAYHIGFIIGPCLNAGGRLQTAELSLQLLLEKNETYAKEMAEELKKLNEERKDMTMQGVEDAIEELERTGRGKQDKVLVVYLPECHESLAGIIAGRLREKYNKPSIVLTRGKEGLKGSGRSIPAYHMFLGLTEVQDLLIKFGGHPMAAGLSLKPENLELFREALNKNCHLTEEDFVKKVWIDAPMPFEYASERLIQELSTLEPFGQGNEKPLFAERNVKIQSAYVVGKNRNVVKMRLNSEHGYPIDGVLFGEGDSFIEEMGDRNRMNVVYYPDLNTYNGMVYVQVVIQGYQFL